MTIPDSDMKDKSESGSDIDNTVAMSSDPSLSRSSSQDECFRSYQHAEASLRVMETYFLNQQLTDVVLIAGERRIPAHRLVLSAGSEYFAAMFTSNLREASQSEVEMKDVNGDALWTLVRYCYTGVIELMEDTVETLLRTACLLQLNEVIEACCAFLKKQLHPSNCIGMQIFADSQGCADLQDASLKFTAEHFMEVVKNMEFLLLPSNELVKLLASDDLNVSSEEDIFHALMSWLEYDLPNRMSDVSTLLGYVKLPLLSPSFIVDHIESVPLFHANPKCRDLIMEAFKYHLLPERRSMLQSPRTYPRKSTLGSLYALGGLDLNDRDTSIEKYDVRMNEWTHAAYMTTRRLQFGVGVIDGKLYVVGGRDGFKTLKTAECCDLKTKVWTNLPDMSTHRHGLGVATLEGPLYAVGGHDGWSYLNSVERWDPQTKTWSNVAPMHTQRSTLGVAVLNGKLYAVGGRDGSNCLNSVECYDPHTNKWILCSPMTKRRGGVSVGVVNGLLYAVGGHEVPPSASSGKSLVCVERYNPRTDTWQVVASMSTGREAVGVCCFGERLFVAGGFDITGCLKLVEAYDPEENKWHQVAPLIHGRAGLCVIAIKNQ